MEAVRGEPGEGGHVVGFVGGLEQEDAARFEDAGDFAEDGEPVGEVFEDVVGEDPIKGGACCFARLPPLLWGRAGVGGVNGDHCALGWEGRVLFGDSHQKA